MLRILRGVSVSSSENGNRFEFPIRCIGHPGLSFHNFTKAISTNKVSINSRVITLPSNGGSGITHVIAFSNSLGSTRTNRTIALALRSRVSVDHNSLLIGTGSDLRTASRFGTRVM